MKIPMILKIVIAAAVLLIALVIIVALRPSDFRVARTGTISAPSSAVFPYVNNLQKWNDWSPWAKLDPNAKNTFEGPDEGTGAVFKWVGNKEVGEGSMTILESRPNELVKMRLDFLKPFASTCMVEFAFKPEGDQTVVTWSMSGKNNFMAKAVGLFMDCEKMVGGQFEQGLAQMKSVMETANK